MFSVISQRRIAICPAVWEVLWVTLTVTGITIFTDMIHHCHRHIALHLRLPPRVSPQYSVAVPCIRGKSPQLVPCVYVRFNRRTYVLVTLVPCTTITDRFNSPSGWLCLLKYYNQITPVDHDIYQLQAHNQPWIFDYQAQILILLINSERRKGIENPNSGCIVLWYRVTRFTKKI